MPRPYPATHRVAHHPRCMPRPYPRVRRRTGEAWPRPYGVSMANGDIGIAPLTRLKLLKPSRCGTTIRYSARHVPKSFGRAPCFEDS